MASRGSRGRRRTNRSRLVSFIHGGGSSAEHPAGRAGAPRGVASVVPAKERVLELGVPVAFTTPSVRLLTDGNSHTPWAASSAGRALRSQRRGREFDPPVVHQPPLHDQAEVVHRSLARILRQAKVDFPSTAIRSYGWQATLRLDSGPSLADHNRAVGTDPVVASAS